MLLNVVTLILLPPTYSLTKKPIFKPIDGAVENHLGLHSEPNTLFLI